MNKFWQASGQIAWKTAPLTKVQLCEYENQTLEAFVAGSRLYVKFDCAVVRQNFSLVAIVHDCKIDLLPDNIANESDNEKTTPGAMIFMAV